MGNLGENFGMKMVVNYLLYAIYAIYYNVNNISLNYVLDLPALIYYYENGKPYKESWFMPSANVQ